MSLLVAVAVFSACQEDLTAEKAKWDSIQKEWSTKVEKTKKGQTELTEKLKVAAIPAEETELVAEKAALDKSAEGITTAIADAEKSIGTAKASIDGLIAKGKKVPVEVALSGTKSTVDGVISRAESLVNAGSASLEQLLRKVTTAGAEREAAKSRTAAWSGEVKKKGGLMAIDDLVFNADQLAVEKSRVALTSLQATLKTCAELRVEVVVTAVSESAELSTKRADALKAFLTGKGIDAAVFAKVSGTSVKEGDEKVAVTVTTPCK
ncbi:MAG: hypothetical protein QM817_33855 [Archangium sp.]